MEETDYLVIGSGIAGLRAAISLGKHGRVLLVNKGRPTESASIYAQGGIAVALDPLDSVESHLEDTLSAGKGLCRREAVEVLVKEGPDRVRELIEWGARFDRKHNRFLTAIEAGHRAARILRAHGDATGTEIMRTLSAQAGRLPTLRWLGGQFTVDLLREENRCVGALLMADTGDITAVFARAVLLATGGAGQVYARTTNPPVATADGVAMAYRAGAVLEDMEFVQFHPTALALPGAPAFLLSEAMRGEGAFLINHKGERFMRRYDPAGDLATRDIVSRAIWSEMQSAGSDHVFLDLSPFKPAFIRERFPTIAETCARYGLDITRSPIPVAPSAHFMIGGVRTDLRGATSLPGLYAAGEAAASGIHGANRLASNSLLEGLVFGARASEYAASSRWKPIGSARRNALLGKHLRRAIGRVSVFPKGLPRQRQILGAVMWRHVGVVRDETGLEKALRRIERWEELTRAPIRSQPEGEFKNLVTAAALITRAALRRKRSLGVHFRADDPKPGSAAAPRHVAFRYPGKTEGYLT